ncbi:universal stress protein [Actinomadura sp. DC4]|uniref:universal stress protein n=1 Tax=Actinomadura sp. DC4 TaxID=3055069 RepID=UPI0025B11955|nr:universal stress protein [Actinomadura sp. DC4]MDN3355353.1 universal stress protein [Actinomadura sp. DC4]
MIREHVLAGYVDDAGGREALALARTIAEVTGARLTVAAVHSPERAASVVEAQAALDHAADLLAGFPADLVAHESRSASRGLSVLASRSGADLIVIGSPAGGAHGRVNLGGTADHLLHAATQAVLLTPAGFTPSGGPRRFTVAYVRRPQCDEAVVSAAGTAARLGVPLRLATLAVDGADPDPLRDDLALALRLAGESTGLAAGEVEAAIGEGDDVAAAVEDLDWVEGDLLICASSEDAPVHRVFLGETAFKVVRAAPCPVSVLPRGRT